MRYAALLAISASLAGCNGPAVKESNPKPEFDVAGLPSCETLEKQGKDGQCNDHGRLSGRYTIQVSLSPDSSKTSKVSEEALATAAHATSMQQVTVRVR